MEKTAIGVDIGGTKVKLGVVSKTGKLINRSVIENTPRSPVECMKRIVSAVSSLLRTVDGRHKNISGIGVAVAGDIDCRNGVVRFSPNLGWRNVEIRRYFKGHFKTDVFVENDANAAAWGIYCVELKRKLKNVVCITLGTGVGGGLVIDGRLYRGSTGSAGEIGHVSLFPDGEKCNCGNYGCVERYIGRDGILKKFLSRLSADKRASADIKSITPETIARAAKSGDKISIETFRETGEQLGVFACSIANIFNPDVIAFTGGISRNGDILFGPMKRIFAKRCGLTRKKTRFYVSKQPENIGIIGSACLVFVPHS